MQTVELTDEVRQDGEAPAFMVFCPSSCAMCDYKVFADEDEARKQAERNHEDEPDREFSVFPLYASHPLDD